MDKQELHDQLAQGPCTISEDVFIEIYGNDRKAPHMGFDPVNPNKKVDVVRANILARVHGLSVSKEGTDYIFTRED